jgi:hypothetical protein
MRTQIRFVAAMQLTLIFPAALLLTAVFVSAGHNPQYDLGGIAQGVVMWYSSRMWTLPLLLIALPIAVLIAGCGALLHSWNHDGELPRPTRRLLAMIPAPLAILIVAWATLTSAGILAIVALHTLAN